jgi:hypothetical protein
MKQKSQRWIWRPRYILNVGLLFFEKKRNLQSPWGMEDWTLPNVGASFKKWGCCTLILPRCHAHPATSSRFQKKNIKNPKNPKVGHYVRVLNYHVVAGRRSLVASWPRPGVLNSNLLFFLLPKIIAHVDNSCWLALAHARPAQTFPKNFKHP